MPRRVRALRLVIVAGYLIVGLGLGFHFLGMAALIPMPMVVAFAAVPAADWITGRAAVRRMTASIQETGRAALTSDQMAWSFSQRAPTVIDDDPKWGKLVEGRDRVFQQNLTAVQVTNSTPEPDGTYKKVWLRVPSRGDRQGTRVCMRAGCGRDISWPPRTAREAIAWTFRLCVDHYGPTKAS